MGCCIKKLRDIIGTAELQYFPYYSLFFIKYTFVAFLKGGGGVGVGVGVGGCKSMNLYVITFIGKKLYIHI